MQKAKKILEDFINEMKSYEIKWGELMQKDLEKTLSEECNQKRLKEVIEIQEKYLSKKALSLQQDRRITLTFGIPPEYNQEIVNENIVNKKKIEFDAFRDGGVL
ncbi:NTF2 fold immunity protein [Acinetobacter gerneri]|uniref:NTF2 fold immunity protein n=1 Tax=Acinetobacter gerneri TaxID=202952 RepID=A0AAW8JSC1_9GAMM|nr:NTF2 fold immunity protein [Acinetobacter gerneri]MDQ9011132.1 NTF2 fold immunity protein [Acinetobacter gerneri]MDQ9015268.1 NTF2 fold immunity protein [Acinetobacter gerneri]MDQ9026439.1 NTF2 fold immunity protein [Acinetobacter gerneri]MDQ9053720.1 NTF2 fold immunity protein [Acinetobacter gerneri]MDQ9061339.1 NTF2 fold immunity protein [Acinetobacter gerneri]